MKVKASPLRTATIGKEPVMKIRMLSAFAMLGLAATSAWVGQGKVMNWTVDGVERGQRDWARTRLRPKLHVLSFDNSDASQDVHSSRRSRVSGLGAA